MSIRATRTGHARPGAPRLREKVVSLPTALRLPLEAPESEARELWMGVHLPWLAIEALQASAPHAESGNSANAADPTRTAGWPGATRTGRTAVRPPPRAIMELQGQAQFVVATCERAQRYGVRPGMSMAAALALVPDLDIATRDVVRERQLLEQLATAAHRFTPRVSLVPPDGLLLEVKGSLHLFGGVESLCQAFEASCAEAGVKPFVTIAPTPLAALACARAGEPRLITQPSQLIGSISSLSLLTLRWPVEVTDRLKQIGVYTIGQAIRLPRAGFARRFGRAQLAELDRLTGRDSDLRERFNLRERFRRRRELLFELEHHEAISGMLEPLFEELGEFLKARQCGVTRVACLFGHRHVPPTRCVLKLAAPAANARHFAKLVGERLATLALPEPVRWCELRSGDLVPHAPDAKALWQPGEHGGGHSAAIPELIEHLRARLGHESVYGLRVVEDHRPERAWATADLASAGESKKTAPAPLRWRPYRRPLWLLPEPAPLAQKNGAPRLRGPLELLSGPERIEAGGAGQYSVARDYYVARDARGVRLWVFRECRSSGSAANADPHAAAAARSASHAWFMQGVFG